MPALSFAGPAVFEGAYFAGDASFTDTRFDRDASFIGATFAGVARFETTQWRGGSRFRDAKFSSPPVCSDLVRFQEATWPEHPGVADDAQRSDASRLTGGGPSPRVFIASSAESLGVAQAIQVHLDHAADPVVWSQGVFAPGGTNLKSLQDELDRSDFGVFVLAADDALEMRGQRLGAPRGNVLIEIGLCVATLGVERTFLIKPRHAQVAVPNDLDGIVVVDYDESREDPISATGAASTRMARVIESRGHRAG